MSIKKESKAICIFEAKSYFIRIMPIGKIDDNCVFLKYIDDEKRAEEIVKPVVNKLFKTLNGAIDYIMNFQDLRNKYMKVLGQFLATQLRIEHEGELFCMDYKTYKNDDDILDIKIDLLMLFKMYKKLCTTNNCSFYIYTDFKTHALKFDVVKSINGVYACLRTYVNHKNANQQINEFSSKLLAKHINIEHKSFKTNVKPFKYTSFDAVKLHSQFVEKYESKLSLINFIYKMVHNSCVINVEKITNQLNLVISYDNNKIPPTYDELALMIIDSNI